MHPSGNLLHTFSLVHQRNGAAHTKMVIIFYRTGARKTAKQLLECRAPDAASDTNVLYRQRIVYVGLHKADDLGK